jgi:hypothetical protein
MIFTRGAVCSPRFYKALKVKIIHSGGAYTIFARLSDFNRKKPKVCKLSLTIKLNLSVILTVKNYFETFYFCQLKLLSRKKKTV